MCVCVAESECMGVAGIILCGCLIYGGRFTPFSRLHTNYNLSNVGSLLEYLNIQRSPRSRLSI